MSNPAGRCYVCLRALQEYGRAQPGEPISNTLWRALMLSADPTPDERASTPSGLSDHARILRTIADLSELPVQIRAAVERLPFDGSVHVNRLDQIEAALQTMVTGFGFRTDQWLDSLSGEAIVQLENCSAVLDREAPELVLSPDTLRELQELVEEAINTTVEAEDLEGEMRVFLLDHLFEMEGALRRYRLTGIDGLRRAVDRTIGDMITTPDAGQRVAGSTEGPTGKVWSVLTKLAVLLTIASSTAQLVQGFMHELPPAHHQPADTEYDIHNNSGRIVAEVSDDGPPH